MRKHAIVIICVMLSFCLHANFPEISGGARGETGGAGSPLFLDQTEARRAEKSFLRPPPPPYLRVCTTGPPSTYLKIWIRHWK